MASTSVTRQIPGYQTFENHRKWEKGGGGLITLVHDDISACQVSDSDQDILTVELILNNEKVRVLNAYAPQEPQSNSDKDYVVNFWTDIETHIEKARSQNCKLIFQCDANASPP